MPLQATFIADFSRWDKALADAQKGLKSFEVTGKGVQRQLENMAKSFSGVEIKKQAEIAVAAVKAVGGVTKLTEQEQRKLNATVTEAIAKYNALGQQAPADMIALAKATEQVAKPTAAAAVSVKTLVAGYLSGMAIWEAAKKVLGGIVEFLTSSVASYAAAEKATKKLTQALKNSGDASAETVKDLSNLASEFQRTTRFSDDLVTEVEALFTQLGDVGPKEMKVAIQAAADLAEGLGVDLEQAATAVSKALQGNDTALRKMAPSLDEAAIKGGDLATIAAEINKQFGGQAAAALDTYSGRVQQLANDWDNVKESIGRALVNDALLRTALRELADATRSVSEANVELTASQIASAALIKSGQGSMGVTIGLLEVWAGNLTRVAEAQSFVNRTLDTLAKKATTVSLKGMFPDITAAGLAEWDRQNDAIDKAAESAKKAATAFKTLRDQLTGQAIVGQLRDLEQVWVSLTPVQQANADIVKRTLEEYEKLRPSLQRVEGPLEDLRSTFQKLIPVSATFQRQITAIASDAMPDAVRMFNAGQAALNLFKRDGDLASRQLVTLKDAMNAVPAELFTKNVRKMAGETEKFADVLEKNLTEALGNVSNIIVDALVHGASFEDTAAAIGAELGAGIGKSIGAHIGGPLGGAIGEALGGLIGPLIEKLIVTRAEKTVKRVAYEFGVSISEELAQGIEDEAERLFGGNRQASKIFHLDEILAEGGGLSADNIKPMFDRFRDLFSMLETGAFSAAQAVEVLDKNFKTFADFVTEGGSLASKELLEIIKLTEETGLRSAEVSAFVVQQLQGALGGLTTFLDNVNVTTQAAAEGISASLFGIFESMTENGVSAADAIKQIGPAIEKLDKQLKAAGLSGGAAFAEIQALAAVAGHEIAGPLITGVLGLEQAMAGLHNSGVLTEEMFDGLTASVADTFAQILATGVDGAKALQLIAPSLQTAWELSEDFGYSLDEATQKLIDEAKAAGLVGDEHRTATEQMLKLTERMTDAVEYLAKAFGYVTDEVDDLGDAIESLPSIPSGPSSESFEPSTSYIPMARGGMVPKYLAGGGPSGTDTVPAWLTPGEFVMRRDAVDRIGANNLEAMNSGGVGAVTNVYVTIQAWDGTDVKRAVQGREFADAFVEAQARNTHTIRTRTKAALQ